MPLDSAPDPDRLSFRLYVFCGDILAENIIEVSKYFFTGKPLTPAYTTSILALIPKVVDPTFSLI